MKHLSGLLLPLLVGTAVGLPNSAWADPGNGFGLYVGAIRASDGVFGTGGRSYGFTLAGDAQFAASDSWSINPYLLVSDEHGDLGSESNNVAGMQFRYWMDGVFVAPQILFHDRMLHSQGQGSTYGAGLGIAVGWEGDNGWILQLQYNTFEGQFFSGFSDRSTARSDFGVQLGYRWR